MLAPTAHRTAIHHRQIASAVQGSYPWGGASRYLIEWMDFPMKSKEQKKKEAAERQAEHDSLTWQGLLLKIQSRPGWSRRERKRHDF